MTWQMCDFVSTVALFLLLRIRGDKEQVQEEEYAHGVADLWIDSEF